MNEQLYSVLNRLTKWRSVFAGWQLGTRPDTDPTCRAVRDHREVTILLRAEVSALVGLLVLKGAITTAEWETQLEREAQLLDAEYQKRFPGFRASDSGISMNPVLARDTMQGWLP